MCSEEETFFPINRFSFDLKEQIDNGDLTAPTANRCLGRVEAFYDWLVDEGFVSKKLGFTSNNGKLSKRRFKNAVGTKTEAEKAFLHALDFEEQRTLVEFLKKSKNIEMRLALVTALLTGMRLQSVLTLKISIFKNYDVTKENTYSLSIGDGTGVDTKFGKSITVFFPHRLMEQLKIYSKSQRAELRRTKNILGQNSDYIFLTSRGNPYYTTKEDYWKLEGNKTRSGDAVSKYIRRNVEKHTGLRLTFHCMRATFAMNCVDSQIALVAEGKITLNEARNFVRERLGHTSSETTDRYLNIRKYMAHSKKIRSNYESTLLDIL